jgi:acyl dehydratase
MSRNRPSASNARTSGAPPPLVRPPVTDRSTFAGLPVVRGANHEGPVLDQKAVGVWSAPALNEIEAGAIRRFAEAMGETNPIYFDDAAARAQGYRSVVAPLAFAAALRSSLSLQGATAPNRTVLSSEQQIESFLPICAGDRILVASRIAEINQRPGTAGPLEFVVVEDEGKTPEGRLTFRTRRTIILRATREALSSGGAPTKES